MPGTDVPLRPLLVRRDDGELIPVPTEARPPNVTLEASGLYLYLIGHAAPPAREAVIAAPPSDRDEPATVRAAFDELAAAGVLPPSGMPGVRT